MTTKLGLRSLSFIAAAAALTLAACGSGDDDDSATAAPGPSAGGGADTVSVAAVEGIGDVLVDSSGQALYFADEEVAAGNEVLCTDEGGCTSFWVPLEPGANAPTAGPGVPELGVIDRPDGSQQVTADGRLLYTFAQDSPGNVTGDGFEDDFGSQHLTWHAMRADGSVPTTGGSSTGALPGYGD
jgi:predicted lipoprotein with Yx(FWY)xxD motif